MKWHNLKQNKCPQCDKDLMGGTRVELARKKEQKPYSFSEITALIPEPNAEKVLVHKCGFKISEKRYAQIVSSQINSDLEDKLNQEQEEYASNH